MEDMTTRIRKARSILFNKVDTTRKLFCIALNLLFSREFVNDDDNDDYDFDKGTFTLKLLLKMQIILHIKCGRCE